MGIVGAPYYGEDFATDIETAKKLLSKIETRTASNEDLKEFTEVVASIVKYASEN